MGHRTVGKYSCVAQRCETIQLCGTELCGIVLWDYTAVGTYSFRAIQLWDTTAVGTQSCDAIQQRDHTARYMKKIGRDIGTAQRQLAVNRVEKGERDRERETETDRQTDSETQKVCF